MNNSLFWCVPNMIFPFSHSLDSSCQGSEKRKKLNLGLSTDVYESSKLEWIQNGVLNYEVQSGKNL